MSHSLSLVPIAASGPQTFRCCQCFNRVYQAEVEQLPIRSGEPRQGKVYADRCGTAFVDYYCNGCRADRETASKPSPESQVLA